MQTVPTVFALQAKWGEEQKARQQEAEAKKQQEAEAAGKKQQEAEAKAKADAKAKAQADADARVGSSFRVQCTISPSFQFVRVPCLRRQQQAEHAERRKTWSQAAVFQFSACLLPPGVPSPKLYTMLQQCY